MTATDNIAFSLHVATLVCHLYEERFGKVPDLGYLYRRALFSSFVTFVHSDISSEVKSRIRSRRPDLYERFHSATYERIAAWELPDFFARDLKAYWNADPSKELEERIFQFSKNWVSYQEAFVNDRVYLRSFEHPLSDIRKRFFADEFADLRELLKLEPSDHGESERFLMAIRRLQASFRWNRMRRSYPVSVMSHLFSIFFLSYLLGNIEGVSAERVTDFMKTALYHDIPEAITGDIITPTKKSVDGLETLIAEIEVEMFDEYLFDFIANRPFAADLKKRMLDPWNCDGGETVKLADVFSALFEAKIEVSANPEFAEAYRRIRRDLHRKYGRPSVDFLFRNGVEPFEENLEEVMG